MTLPPLLQIEEKSYEKEQFPETEEDLLDLKMKRVISGLFSPKKGKRFKKKKKKQQATQEMETLEELGVLEWEKENKTPKHSV